MVLGIERRLCLFTRYPRPGQTKTRLIPLLGPHGAADLQRALTDHMARRIRAYRTGRQVDVQVWYAGGDAGRMQQWLGRDFSYHRQSDGDIGQKMLAAMQRGVADGCHYTIIVGSDIPQVTPALFSEAFSVLDQNDMVLGPALDGGYYLLGLNTRRVRVSPAGLFRGINWGSVGVLRQTLDAAKALGLCAARLKTLRDIDRPADLAVWRAINKAGGA